MPPRKILKNKCPDIEFGDIMESLIAILCVLISKLK